MGDRVIMKVKSGNEVSPAIYGHWCGINAEKLIRGAAPKMRKGDVPYAAAALAAHVFNENDSKDGRFVSVGLLDKDEESHGGAGVYIVDIDTGQVSCTDGYGKPFRIDPLVFCN